MAEEGKTPVVVVDQSTPVEEVKETEVQVETPEVVNDPTNEEQPITSEEEDGSGEGVEEVEEQSEDAELDTNVWGDTGSEVGNSTLNLLQNAGVSTEEAKALLYDAVLEGDPSKIDQAALEAKVGKAKAALVLAGVNGFIAETAKKNEAVRNTVFEAAGDKDTWNTMIDWAKKSGTDLSEYAPMIDAGGAQARFAVAEIRNKYNADANNTAIPANGSTPRQEATTTANPSIEPITSAAEYAKLYDKAYNANNVKEMERLTQARRLGRKLQQG